MLEFVQPKLVSLPTPQLDSKATREVDPGAEPRAQEPCEVQNLV